MKNVSPTLPNGRLIARCLFLLLLSIFLRSEAFASFNVCNQSDQKVYIALGYYEADRWFSRGWWEAEAGECIQLIPALSGHHYYLYAYHAEGGMWSGETPFCTAEETFNLPKEADCTTKFFQVNTQGHEQWTHFLYREGARYFSEGAGSCDVVRELTARTAPYLERFANQFLAALLVGKERVSFTSNASFKYTVLRTGPARVRPGPAGRFDGSLQLTLPIRMINAQVEWREESGGQMIWHHEKIQDQTAQIQFAVHLRYENGLVRLLPHPPLQWDRTPFYFFMDKKVDIDQLATPSLTNVLQQMTRVWQYRFAPIFGSFARGDCAWQEEIARAIHALDAFERSRQEKRTLQPESSLAKKSR